MYYGRLIFFLNNDQIKFCSWNALAHAIYLIMFYIPSKGCFECPEWSSLSFSVSVVVVDFGRNIINNKLLTLHITELSLSLNLLILKVHDIEVYGTYMYHNYWVVWRDTVTTYFYISSRLPGIAEDIRQRKVKKLYV